MAALFRYHPLLELSILKLISLLDPPEMSFLDSLDKSLDKSLEFVDKIVQHTRDQLTGK